MNKNKYHIGQPFVRARDGLWQTAIFLNGKHVHTTEPTTREFMAEGKAREWVKQHPLRSAEPAGEDKKA